MKLGLSIICALLILSNLICDAQGIKEGQLQPLTSGGAKVVPDFWSMDSLDTSPMLIKYLGVSYGKISKAQTLDIYLPNLRKEPAAVIIAVHGGGFSMGHSRMKTDVSPMLEGVKRGYAVVSVNYRLSGEATFPRAVNDVKAAVRFLKANAENYNIDTNRMVIWGGSAGGNLASMVGTTGNITYLDGDNRENLNHSSSVQAVIDWFGPCDFTSFDQQFQKAGFKEHNSSISENSHESWYIGQNVLKDVSFTQKANPTTYIKTLDPGTAPVFLIQHGSLDPVVPLQQSIDFYNALRAKLGDKKVKFKILEGAHHFSPEFSSEENLLYVFDFLKDAL